MGTIALQQGRLHENERHCARAVDAFRADGDRTGEAAALVGLARVRLARGLVPGAVMLGRQAVAVHDEVGLPLRGANARYALGIALTQAGRHDEARTVLQQAQEVFRDHRRPLWEGMAFSRLAELELAAEHPRRAAAHAEQALAQLSRSGGDWRRGAVLVTLGRALHAMEQTDRARVCWQEALTLFEGHDTAETGKAEEVRGLLGSTAALSSASPLPGTSSLPGGNGEARGTG
ncbi:afsB protein [Streptomyces clavuligerus]|nr:tetratricopeptide repeat protein [Streptomyces clavuligerus]EDY52887.1 afsB protein [Streptomyces clavuligerus]